MEDLRDLYRFLWNEGDSKLAPQAYRFLSMLQGATDSPYISAATIHKHLDDVIAKADDPDTIKAAELIKLRLYIDDLVLSLGSIKEAIKIRQQICAIFEDCGMKMCKYLSNSPEVMASIPEHKRAPINDEIQFNAESCDATLTKLPTQTKVIGLTWKPKEDIFSFEQYKRLAESADVKYTKRGISSLIPRIYDVNGYIAPFILRGKLILQECWTHRREVEGEKKALGWDDTLPPDIENAFKEWIADIPKIAQHVVPRYLFQGQSAPDINSMELHGFVDAGGKVWGVVVDLPYPRKNNISK